MMGSFFAGTDTPSASFPLFTSSIVLFSALNLAACDSIGNSSHSFKIDIPSTVTLVLTPPPFWTSILLGTLIFILNENISQYNIMGITL